MPQFDLYALLFPKFFRGPDDQGLIVGDYIPDVIGEFSGPIGDKLSFLQHGDIDLRIFSPGRAGRRRSGRRSPDDEQIRFLTQGPAPPIKVNDIRYTV